MTPSTTHSKGAGEVLISQLIIGERYRKDTTEARQKIADELVPLIADKGLIQPIVVELTDDGQFKLVAGWRRTVAMTLLGHEYIPYVFRKNLSESEAAELEMDENEGRSDPSFAEKVLGIERVHKLRRAASQTEGHSWGVRQTGKLLNTAHGAISELLQAAVLIRQGDKEIENASSLVEVRQIRAKRKLDQGAAVLKKMHEDNIGLRQLDPPKQKSISLVGDDVDLSSSILEPDTTQPRLEIPITSWLLNMDCHDWFATQPEKSVDGIYTDIPYGIPTKDMEDFVDADRILGAHDEQENLLQMPRFIEGAWKVLKDDSYLIFWYDLRHHNFLVNELLAAGFSVQRWPLIWLKPSGRNKAANQWFTKAIEYVMVARKGKATLLKPQPLNYRHASAAAERKIYLNPFFKSWEISHWILEPLVIPGSTWIDCYMGESSLIRILIERNAKVVGIEKDTSHYNRALEHIKAQLRLLHHGEVIFT